MTAPAPAGAADNEMNQRPVTSWQETLLAQEQAEEIRVARNALIRDRMLERQELSGRVFDDGWARRMQAYLETMTLEELEGAPEASIGDNIRDLVFTPLDTPCRFYDSRNAAGGRLTPSGGDRTLIVAGGAIPGNQGAALFCGVPNSAVAVVINVLAVDPLSKGNFQMWASDGAPGDSVINYGGPSLGINLINGVMVPICNPFISACGSDLVLRTNFASSHAVINVTGFFSPPEPSPLDCLTLSNQTSVSDFNFDFNSPSCPESYSLTGGGHDWFGTITDVWFWQVSPDAAPNDNRFRCRGINTSTAAADIKCFARCCRIPGESAGLLGPPPQG